MLEWKTALQDIRSQIGRQEFETWFKPVRLISISSEAVDLSVPNRFYLSWLSENYIDLISKTIFRLTHRTLEIRIHVETSKEAKHSHSDLRSEQQIQKTHNYTLQNFIVYEANSLLYQVIIDIVNSASTVYNPLYIYGPAGVGKSHILKAMKEYVIDNDPDTNVAYLSADDFMNEMSDNYRRDQMDQFRNELRTVDMLLFDDVYRLAGKKLYQEEFHFLICALQDNLKRVVVSSDRPPKEINDLNKNIRSRLSGGLILPVHPPDFETKKRILLAACALEDIIFPEEVLSVIAGINETNMNRLIRYVIRLSAITSISGKIVDINDVKKLLKSNVLDVKGQIEKIQKTVAQYFSVTLEDILSQQKTHEVSQARQIAVYLSRTRTGLPFSKLGDLFGGKDHSTMLKAYKRIKQKASIEYDIKNIISDIDRLLIN
jgi:chromosomal replication initiator protein